MFIIKINEKQISNESDISGNIVYSAEIMWVLGRELQVLSVTLRLQ